MWDIAFSRTRSRRIIYMATARTSRFTILRRDTLQELTAFGDGGRQPGQFYGVHASPVDSKGNIYTPRPTKAIACSASSTKASAR